MLHMPPHLYELSGSKPDVLRLDDTNLRSRSGRKKYFMLSQSAIVTRSPSPEVAHQQHLRNLGHIRKRQGGVRDAANMTPLLSKQPIGDDLNEVNEAQEIDNQMRAAA